MRQVLTVACLLVAAVGCDQPEPRLRDPDYSEPMVNAFLYRTQFYDNSVEYDRYIEVIDGRGLRMVPLVTLNRESMPVYYYSPTQYRYADEKPFPVKTRYYLRVRHYWGEAFSRVVMPGDFRINRPPENYILDIESTLVVTWNRSEAAQWYWVSLYLDYDYNDSFGVWNNFEFDLDTLVEDTMISLPRWRTFPREVMDVLEGDGAVNVWSGNGPAVEPGDIGNVRGNGFGFFNATNEPREKYFYVGAPPRLRRVPGTRTSLGRLQERFAERSERLLALARER